MLLFYMSIPVMILGIAVALVPLVWAMRHQNDWEHGLSTATKTENETAAPKIAA